MLDLWFICVAVKENEEKGENKEVLWKEKPDDDHKEEDETASCVEKEWKQLQENESTTGQER